MLTRILGVSVFLLVLAACSLNASQEQALNKQTALYLDALNERSVLSVVARTYPEYVRYARSQGGAYFAKAFQPDTLLLQETYSDPSQGKIASKGPEIHVLYTARREYFSADSFESKEYTFVALSQDDGKNWFFMPHSVYTDRKICPGLKRLLP